MNSYHSNKYRLSDLEARYFHFERDFMEDNIRCIPMLVRFKLDACGVKLKLMQWSRFSPAEREVLNDSACASPTEIHEYRKYLAGLIKNHTGYEATLISVEENPAWADEDRLLPELQEQAEKMKTPIDLRQWKSLTRLQRFALIKLCRPGHENRNFPIAMKEFGLCGHIDI